MHRKIGIWSTGKRIFPISSDDGDVGDFFVDKFEKNIKNYNKNVDLEYKS